MWLHVIVQVHVVVFWMAFLARLCALVFSCRLTMHTWMTCCYCCLGSLAVSFVSSNHPVLRWGNFATRSTPTFGCRIGSTGHHVVVHSPPLMPVEEGKLRLQEGLVSKTQGTITTSYIYPIRIFLLDVTYAWQRIWWCTCIRDLTSIFFLVVTFDFSHSKGRKLDNNVALSRGNFQCK